MTTLQKMAMISNLVSQNNSFKNQSSLFTSLNRVLKRKKNVVNMGRGKIGLTDSEETDMTDNKKEATKREVTSMSTTARIVLTNSITMMVAKAANTNKNVIGLHANITNASTKMRST